MVCLHPLGFGLLIDYTMANVWTGGAHELEIISYIDDEHVGCACGAKLHLGSLYRPLVCTSCFCCVCVTGHFYSTQPTSQEVHPTP